MVVATCTGGERGSILNPAMDRPDVLADIGAIRRAEMDRAREILGVEQVWLGFVDSGLPEGDPLPPLPDGCFAALDLDVAVAPLVKVIRQFQPHVLTTYDENGGYPHPDHIMCHKISVAAFDAAGRPGRLPGAGRTVAGAQAVLLLHLPPAPGWRPWTEAMTERGLESPYADRLKDWPEDPEQAARITTRVPCADYFDVRDRALLAHATQVDPEGPWFSVPLDLHKTVWPTEDWQRVRSLVDAATARGRPVRRDRGAGRSATGLRRREVGRVSA